MERKLKVLFITNIPAPYKVDFYNELGRYCDVTVVFEAKRPFSFIRFNWNDNSIKYFKGIFLTKIFNKKRLSIKVFKYLLDGKYDIIVMTNYAYLTDLCAILVLKLKRMKYFYETDGGIINHTESKAKKMFKSFMLSGATGYFSPSSSSDEYLNYYGAQKNKIYRYCFTSLMGKDIPLLQLTKEQKYKLRKELGIKESKVILAIGQFVYRKGFDLLLKAVVGLDDDTGVYIVGGVPTEEYQQLKRDLNLKNVHFEGFKKSKELCDFFNVADLFVHPTREDIWGLVINEAMAYRLPIITTEKCVAGIELLQSDCIVPVNDIMALHEKIKSILYDDEMSIRIGNENYNKIKKCTIEKMALEHYNTFKKIHNG